jgi:hypothetical protein
MILYVCPNGHVSSVARFPNQEGVRRCFFCPAVAQPQEFKHVESSS